MSYYGRLNTGLQVGAAISPSSETDSYRTCLIKGLTYDFSAAGYDTGNGSLRDPMKSLTSPFGKQYAFAHDVSTSNRNAVIVFTAGSTGDLMLNVGENGRDATGSYSFTISAGHTSDYNDLVKGSKYGDAIAGLDGNDSLFGQSGNDYLYGQSGADSLYGGDNEDNILAGLGNDIVRGQTGSDVIDGGAGADRLSGGAGSDRFVFSLASDSRPESFDRIFGRTGRPLSAGSA